MTESTKSDFTPRAYQIDLYEKALKHNTILYLPTGSGKTYIAVLLLKKLSYDVQELYSKNGKRSIYIVNTVPLVTQQSEYVKRHTGLTCGGYSGELQVDYWSGKDWLTELENNQVLVMTAQIFVDMLTRGYTKLDRINLIIFDECHRAVSSHPMRQIMQLFENYPKEHQPRVLAMSATLLNANIKADKIEHTIRTLEITFHAKIATVKSTDSIQEYCTNPKESIVKYKPYICPDIIEKVNQIVETTMTVLGSITLNSDKLFMESSPQFQPRKKSTKLQGVIKDIQMTTLQTGIYGGSKSALLHLIQLECLKKYNDDIQTITILEYMISQVSRIIKFFHDEMKDHTELERIHKFSSDQIHTLFQILNDFHKTKSDDQKFCCIIFVKERFMTQVVYHILKCLSTHDERYSFLLPDFVVGFQNSPYKNSREALCISKWNKEVLQRFKSELSNCIAATDVVDEGIDVPICTLIIRYDLPLDYRGYVQSKGRARYGTSHFKVLMPNNDDAFLQRYRNYKHTELILKTILMESDTRSLPTDLDIKCDLYNHEIEPYIIKRDNDTISVLTETNAVSLINAYCNTLMKSKFVQLVPIWALHEISESTEKLYQVSLKLPIISPLKDVTFGDLMNTTNSAKRSAAMKCCIKLHQLGALTDTLLPVKVNEVPINVDYLFPNWINEEGSSCGTYKKKRQHKIEHPMILYGAFPHHEEKLYLHVLHITPTYSVPYDNRHLVFYNLLNDKSGFGILSSKSMPKIPNFPIFMNVGELHVNLKINYATMVLNEEDLKLLKVYHTVLFHDVIPVLKKFMVFDNDNLDNSFLIVPLNAEWEINWDVTKYQHVERTLPSHGEDTPFHVRDSDYELALVTPNYRASPSIYVVTRVCDDLTPESCFPTDDFDSYAHYYKERHAIAIQNMKQPLLEVKPISSKINCIRPRSMKPGLSKRRRADVLEDFEEHLIPELCQKIHFPALYWLKATTLPSILHRITQLLIAEDLRIIIAKEAHLGTLTLPSDKKWPSLEAIEKEIEQLAEPLLDTTLDDTIESTQLEPDLNGLELDVFNTEANSYPWSKDHEPQDLYRNMDMIQVMDIQYYHHFMAENNDTDNSVKNVRTKNINYISKPIVSVPTLNILLNKKTCGPTSVEVMQALTSKMGHDIFDLERLETLGDSYLKFITSLFLYQNFPTFNEGQLTTLKGKIIGNRNLYYNGTNKGIPGRIKVDDFVPMSTFIVPAYTVFRPFQKLLLDKSVLSNILYELSVSEEERFTGYVDESTMNTWQEQTSQWGSAEIQTGMEHFLGIQIVPDKTVADSVEALIGVYLKNCSMTGAAELLRWFGILPDIRIDEVLRGSPLDPVIGTGDPDEHMPWADSLEAKFGYKFSNRAFLLQAFTHPSYSANGITDCYQRLEFLGDAILDFLITCYIYENFESLNPGALTDLRSALVNNITFACLAVRYGLHTNLLAYAPKLHEIIDRFVKFQEERDYVINDELLWVLLEEEDCNMAEYVDVPKVLGDLFETLIGAIYLDSGKNLTQVWEIVYSLMHKEIDEFSKNIPKQPVRVIYENHDAHPRFLEATLIKDTNIIMVPLKLIIGGKEKVFHGFGANKKLAKCAAAKQALKRLRSQK